LPAAGKNIWEKTRKSAGSTSRAALKKLPAPPSTEPPNVRAQINVPSEYLVLLADANYRSSPVIVELLDGRKYQVWLPSQTAAEAITSLLNPMMLKLLSAGNDRFVLDGLSLAQTTLSDDFKSALMV
jgi:hypothetical protein